MRERKKKRKEEQGRRDTDNVKEHNGMKGLSKGENKLLD